MMSDCQENANPKDTVEIIHFDDDSPNKSDRTPLGQRRQRRRRPARSRMGTSTSTSNHHGILSDSTNQFDGFKLRRLLQDHSSSMRLAQNWSNREDNEQQVHQYQQRPPPIQIAASTAHAYRQFSNPMSPSSYDPIRSIGPPPLSPVLSSPRGSSSSSSARTRSSTGRITAGPEGVQMLEPSYPRDSLLHKVMDQPHNDDDDRGEGRDDSASQSMPSKKSSPPTLNNDAKSVRVHNVSKSLAHHAEPSSLAAIAELSRRYAPSRAIQGLDVATRGLAVGNIGNAGIFDAQKLAAHGIGIGVLSPMERNTATRTPTQHWNYQHSSSSNLGSPIGSVIKSVVNSTEKVHHGELNESDHEMEPSQDAIAAQQQSQDCWQVGRLGESARLVTIRSLMRNAFAKGGRRLASSRQTKPPTQIETGQQEGAVDATQEDQAKDLDIVVTTNTTPSTVDESEELSMISMSPRLATRSSNSGGTQQRQDLEEYSDRAAFERGAEFILQLGHLLGKTCTTFLTPHNQKRLLYRQNHEDDDNLSTTSSLSSIAPRVIVPLATSNMNNQNTSGKGAYFCSRFVRLLCGICSFVLGLSIAAGWSTPLMLESENVIMPSNEMNDSFFTVKRARTQKPVLPESQDIMSNGTYNEMELHSNKVELEQCFLGFNDIIRSTAVSNAEPSVQDNFEEEKDDVGTATENHLFEGGFPENAKVPKQLGKRKDYSDFVSLQELLRAIHLHRWTKVRAIARIPRTLPTPPRFWQPRKFAVPTNTSVPAELVGTMSRALVHIPSPADLTPIVNIDISDRSEKFSPSEKDFSDLYYQTWQYNEQTGEDFDIPLSQFLGEILQEYRRAKRKRSIEEAQAQLLAAFDQSVEVATTQPGRQMMRRKKNPFRRLADWLKRSLSFGM